MYGALEHPETFLFTTQDYRKATARNELFSRFVSVCFGSKTLFCVGTSPEGIEDFLSGLAIDGSDTRPQRPHFALVPEEENFPLQEALFRTKYGIQLLGYKPTLGYPQILAFLRKLNEKVVSRPRPARAPARTPRLDRVELQNIGPFDSLKIDLHAAKAGGGAPDTGHWNVLLGNNGCGKSTLLRAIALGLSGGDRDRPIGRRAAVARGCGSRLD